MVRFLHTADLQLGKPFQWAEDRAEALQTRREECISRLAEAAGEYDANFVVIAGDFFDDNTVDDRVVVRACERLQEFEVPVLILPGNHDASGAPDSVYRRVKFVRNKPEWVTILTDAEPHVVLDGRAVILPAPLQYRHSSADPTEHLTSDFGYDLAPDAVRIGLAHGTVNDFGESPNVIKKDRAQIAELDYLALGDWHGRKEINARTWYSGTPEPTSFDERDPGYALIVDIDGPGERPEITSVDVGSTDWVKEEVTLEGSDDLDALEFWFESLERPLDTLVRLEYDGSLSLNAKTRLENEILSDVRDRLLFLRERGHGLVPRASQDELDEMSADGFVGATVRELREKRNSDNDESDTAARALELMHRLMHRGAQQ